MLRRPVPAGAVDDGAAGARCPARRRVHGRALHAGGRWPSLKLWPIRNVGWEATGGSGPARGPGVGTGRSARGGHHGRHGAVGPGSRSAPVARSAARGVARGSRRARLGEPVPCTPVLPRFIGPSAAQPMSCVYCWTGAGPGRRPDSGVSCRVPSLPTGPREFLSSLHCLQSRSAGSAGSAGPEVCCQTAEYGLLSPLW
jgi:hypothetical protein